MSFTSEVKDEVSRVEATCSQCDRAELAALMRIEGTLNIDGERGMRLEIATETGSVARTAIRLLHDVYDLQTDLTVRRSVLHKTHNYLITVPSQPSLSSVLDELGVFDAGVRADLVERACCAGAYLRGAFLAGGYIADPKGDFHFELTTSTEKLAAGIVDMMREHGIAARSTRRHKNFTVYLKGAGDIIAFLAFVGAHRSALAMEDVRVLKSVRNDTNRRVNAEIANQVKSVDAAMQQIARIRALIESSGIDALPESLREVALLRLQHPHSSIKELGEYADPPLSKSAVYHRMRRINAMVEASRH